MFLSLLPLIHKSGSCIVSKWNHTVCSLLLTCFWDVPILLYKPVVLFFSWVVSHYMTIPQSVYSFTQWQTMDFLTFWAIMNKLLWTSLCKSFLWAYALISLRLNLPREIYDKIFNFKVRACVFLWPLYFKLRENFKNLNLTFST